MKALAFATTLCSVLAVSAMQPSHPQPQAPGGNFQLAFCNMSDFRGMLVTLMHKKDAQSWEVEGWYPVPDSGCAPLGTFPRDTVYYFAQSSEGAVWRAADNDQTASVQCVDLNKWFQAGAAGTPTCPSGQQSVRFRMITVPANLPRVTWTLTGTK